MSDVASVCRYVQCRDCEPGSPRAVGPDGFCTSHRRARAAAQKLRRRETDVARVYSLPAEAYRALQRAQRGLCAICQRANGKTKALAVDHDHKCCPGRNSCGRCVRGLLCGPCNKMLGHLRDSTEALMRARDYLIWPPAKDVLP